MEMVVCHLLLRLINIFDKTQAAIFLMQTVLPEGFPMPRSFGYLPDYSSAVGKINL